ncbi:hypothetical protein [Desertibacillus haloalkaliphilus]|uniref:hypothetical protein n=1 Tax=Desertibacillus haloalkaliphilus TaxID=1328930 RepID=UPI001C261C7F|nr:hypothetical protein [Desertibacillus haloalkaliphilus]MBU8907528.1 hypothetical protein [Desertibacillus haloalkaliphilus]
MKIKLITLQYILLTLSAPLLIFSVIYSFQIGIYIGLFFAIGSLILNYIRLGKNTYLLGHPDRHYDKGNSHDYDGIMEESYEEGRKNKDKENP